MIRAELAPSEPLRAPAWARPGGSFRENSEAEALFFAGAALVRARFRRQIRPALGRRLAPPPGAEKRRRGGAEPAQPARGRGGAARRDRPRETRAGARAGGTGLRRLPHRSRVPAILCAPRASPPSPPTCRRRSIRERRRSSPPRSGRRAGAAGRPRSPRPRPLKRSWRSSPTPSRSRFFAPTPRWPGPSAGQRRCRCSPASCSCAAPQARDGGRGRARPAGASSWRSLTHGRRSPPSTWRRTCRAGRPGSPTPRQNCAPRGRRARIEALLADDAVSAAAPIAGFSDRARRRLFERLVALGAARELTGRPTFRLYGL